MKNILKTILVLLYLIGAGWLFFDWTDSIAYFTRITSFPEAIVVLGVVFILLNAALLILGTLGDQPFVIYGGIFGGVQGLVDDWSKLPDEDRRLWKVITPILLIGFIGLVYGFQPQILEMLKPDIPVSTPVPVSETFTVDQTYQVDEATALQQFRLACPFSKTATITVVTEGIKIASKNCQATPFMP